MKKTIIVLSTVAVIGLGSAFTGSAAHADTVKDLEGKQTEVKSERSEIKAKLSKADAKIVDVLFDLKELNEDITRVEISLKANQKMMKEAKADISNTEGEIEVLESEIVELEEGIEARFDILKDRATSYQRNGGDIGYLEVLIGSKDFGEFISRASAVTKITESDAELLAQQEEDKEQVEIRQGKVEEKLAEQLEMKVELEGMEAVILDQQEQNYASEKKLKTKEKELTKLKTDLEGKDSTLASLESEIRQDISAARAPVISNSNSGENLVTLAEGSSDSGNGQFAWPTSGGYISSYQGERWGRSHKGIDIARTDRSTSPPIFSVAEGTVASAGDGGDGYGNKVIINHSNGLKTVYAHLASINVQAGQSVGKGSQIGVMGTTGSSTGIHLHFEVYKNGALQNPMGYLN